MLMLKNLVIALGIAALTSTSALAAAKSGKMQAKTQTHVTHKVAQSGDAKPAEAKAKPDKKVDKKADRKDKKMKAEKPGDKSTKKAEKAGEAAPAPAK